MNKRHTPQDTLLTLGVLFLCIIVPYTTAGTSSQSLPQEQQSTPETPSKQPVLQEQIDNAAAGETILLAATTYTECLTITKPIHLKGQGTTETFLSPTSSANGCAIMITSENVIISDIEITNLGPGLYTTGIQISAPNTTIQDCLFHDTPIGIAIWSSYTTITNCTFTNCDDEGIVLLGTTTTPCHHNTITRCLFSKNCDGIELQHAPSNHITDCSFTHNTHAGIDGIEANNNNNRISSCTFSDNQAFGLYLTKSSENLITDCSFSDDTITLVQTVNTTLARSSGANIHLMKGSTLHIEACTDIDYSEIVSLQSTYQISSNYTPTIPDKNNYLAYYLSFIQNLLFRFKISTLFSERLYQYRM